MSENTNNEQNAAADVTDVISATERKRVWAWAIFILTLFLAGAIVGTWFLYVNKTEALERHAKRMNPEIGEGGSRPPSAALAPGSKAITAGIYVDRIIDLSVRETTWTADFYVWFRWKGDGADPGEKIQIVDGSIESKEKLDEYTAGDERYTAYRVVAKTTKFFDVSRFPRDDHVLTLAIENPASERREFVFAADTEGSGVSSRVRIPGYSMYRDAIIEKPHAYSSSHGDPRLAAGTEKVQSQLRMGLWIQREGWGFYLKMFIALFAAVGVAMLAFFIKPTEVDPRFGLGVGGLGAVIVNTYITSSLVPDTGIITLADIMNQIGIVTVSLSLMQSAISLYLYEKRGKIALSGLFDKVSFAVFVTGYVAINVALAIAATNWIST